MTPSPHGTTGRQRATSLFRIYLGGAAVATWLIAMTDTRSLLHVVGSTSEGAALAWLTMLVGLAALLDGVVNDILPARFCWRAAVRQRHFILATMAFCYVAQLYVAFFNLRSTGLLIYYLWNAGAIMALAFFDAHQRSKEALCVIICT